MRLKVGLLSFVFLFAGFFSQLPAAFKNNSDIPVKDTAVSLSEVAVVAHIKQKNDLRLEPLSSSVLKMGNVESRQVLSLNDFSNYTPNLYIPEYGSKMTSSIYIRGLGSRMDNPAVGLYVDNIPYLNKNGFDSDLWDIMRMEVLRGPQSTLYGRNTIGGIINMHTLSPMVYQGTRFSVGYGNGNTFSAKGSTYWKPTEKFAFSIGVNWYSTDGFFDNEYNPQDGSSKKGGSNCDWVKSGSGRFRIVYKPGKRFTIDNSFMASRVEQGGYAYSLFDTESGVQNGVNYNDPSGYVRTSISNGLSLNYQAPGFVFSSVTSWQFLDDKMTLDQDFTSKDMFTMYQAQKEHTVTQDFVFKSNGEDKKWQWLTGLTLFYKNMDMDAPVNFKQDGINTLILNNINSMFQAMPAPMSTANLSFDEPQFGLLSNFHMPVLGVALYHQSQYSVGKFTFTAGLRFDYECAKIDYCSNSEVDYTYSMKIQMGQMLRPVEVKSNVTTLLEDKLTEHYFEVLPKFAAQYSMGKNGNLYASVSRGFKAGGFNTQMFSDILQNQVKTDLMADLMSKAGSSLGSLGSAMGGTMGGSSQSYTVEEIITYKPEYSWNYEVGAHLNFLDGRFVADAALFYIDCTDQQLTVFPSGTTTGRMMTNAGQTRSYGAEVALNGKIAGGLDLSLSYGYTNAKFVKYNDGHTDYKGNFVPYVPQNTLNATASYTFYRVGNCLDRLSFRAGYNGIGKIYWNEENSMSQKFYSLLNASIYAQQGAFSLELWGKNLANAEYNAFYFVSVGNTFFSAGKPANYGVTLSVEF